jgi:hypothetical protein
MTSEAPPTRTVLLPGVVEERLRNWWNNGGQERPCILAAIPRPAADLRQADDLQRHWLDPDFIIGRKMREIDSMDYFGMAVPQHYVDHGSSAMAGVLGCPLEFVDRETIWAHPRFDSLDAMFDADIGTDGPVYDHIRDITRRSAALAKGHHFLAPFALEGLSDLMAALYGMENFLMDLLERPDDVARMMRRLNEIWLRTFSEIQGIIRESGNPGGIGWVGIWAPGSTFPLQEDVSYNFGPELFRKLLVPHIREQIAAMEYSFFHVDGVGMIPHLDALLEIPELRAIQWQPGAGKESLPQWYGLLRKILASGKSLQVYARAAEVDDLVRHVGADRLLIILQNPTREEALCLADKYGGRT